MDNRFLLIDGSSLFYRAFHALPLLNASGGEYTNAVLGFANMLAKLWQEVDPQAVVIAFDKGKTTFRHAMFADYKGQRQKTPPELSSQIPLLHEFAAALGVNLIEMTDYEADDIIGTLARDAAAQGWEVSIVTGDRDALQLVAPKVRVLFNKKGISEMTVYDEAAFLAEYQFPPLRLIDLKSLMGDKSDNIPGVAGIGAVTAGKLIRKYGTLEEVLAHVAEIPGTKLRNSLTEQTEQAHLSKRLATIEQNMPGLGFAAEKFACHPIDGTALHKFCQRYGLKSVWKHYEKIFSFTDLAPTLAIDAVTERLQPTIVKLAAPEDIDKITAPVMALAVCYRHKVPSLGFVAAAVLTTPTEATVIENDGAMFGALRDATEAAGTEKIFGYGAKQLRQLGWPVGDNFFDIKLAAYLLRPEMNDYELPTLISLFCPEVEPKMDFAGLDERVAWEGAAIWRLGRILEQRLEEQNLSDIYRRIELPLASVLAEMEQLGLYVNRTHLAAQAQATAQKVSELEQEIYDLAKGKFKINSPKQLGEILFDRLGLTPLKKTKTGYSTDAEVLEGLRAAHPIVERILAYRMWSKLKSTYLDGLAELIDPVSERVHTNLHQTVTATGRLSSSDPNLQNIPVRTEEGRAIRSLFEPGDGYDMFLSADYSQIELRILAHMSGDENFIDAFRHNEDVHARTASEVFEVPPHEVTPELRRKAKAVNFGIVYGISDYGLSRDLGISRHEAADYIARYFAKYPGVKRFLDNLVAEARERGYVTTMYGRRRELSGIRSSNFNQRSLAERMAMNTPIQGTAADIIKLAMLRTAAVLREHKLKSRMLLQVHDELLLEVTAAETEQVTALVREAMEGAANLKVPLVVDINLGKNWAEAK